MVGLDHGQNQVADDTDAERDARNTRIGLRLFLAYTAVYAGFVAINAFRPDLMERTPVGGINLAVLYGFGLIIGALILSLAYGWLCQAPASRHSPTGDNE